MAGYFTYKSLADLQKAVHELGLDIDFEPELQRILQPVEAGDRRLGNALAIHPMEGCDAEPDGTPGELTRRRYLRFAAGGAKLIWCEATAITPSGRANPRQLWLHAENWQAYARLLQEIRATHRREFGDDADLLIGLQLTHSGRWSYKKPVIAVHDPAVDAATRRRSSRGLPPDYPIISDDELERLEDDFVTAAELAHRAGFDFVDLKQCHTYLLNELLGARSRPGRYGGSWENRTRFIRNVVGKIRDRVPQLLLASRINMYDGVPWRVDNRSGRTAPVPGAGQNAFGVEPTNPLEPDLREPIALVRLLLQKGVRLFNLSMGSPYFSPHLGRPFEKPAPGTYAAPEHPLRGVARHFHCTAAIKANVAQAVIVGTGYSYLRQFFPYAAEANLRRRRVDLVGLGRGAIAYPDFAADLMRRGRLDPKKVCLTVSLCTALMRATHPQSGQAPAGCVPRDRLYARIYREVR